MSKTSSKRVFSGVQPSGAQVHIGNYLGAMKRFVELSKTYQTIVCIVDLHALTSVDRPAELLKYTQSLAAAYLAIGLDPENAIIFKQSDVPAVCELTWYLGCQFPLGLLERGHAIKDARARGQAPNAGLLYYPILMAADILLYRATLVPVGADQKQHIEMTRDVAQRFNTQYGDLFPMPEPLIESNTSTIPGLDGRKMSKSYDNYIGLFESPKEVEKKIKRIVTDSLGVDDPKNPDECNVFGLFSLFASPDEIASLRKAYLEGGFGYGEAKARLFEVVEREIFPLRARYQELIANVTYLEEVLSVGRDRAGEIAQETIEDVRRAVGVRAIG